MPAKDLCKSCVLSVECMDSEVMDGDSDRHEDDELHREVNQKEID